MEKEVRKESYTIDFTIPEIWNILTGYIDRNKQFYNIKNEKSIETLQELLNDIKTEYEDIEE